MKALPKQAVGQSGRSSSSITAGKAEQKKTRSLEKVVRDLIDKKWPGLREQQMHHNIVREKSLFQFVSGRKAGRL